MLVHIVPLLSCLIQCHLLSIFCTFVIEQINDDDDDDELRARLLSNIHSTVDLYSTRSDLKSVKKSCPPFEQSGGQVTSSHTISNR